MNTPTLSRINDLEIRLYKLTTKSHLAIGTGEASAELSSVGNPIIKAMIYEEASGDTKKVPYVPASSLHGVIRSWVEKALRSMSQKVDVQERLKEMDGSIQEQIKQEAKKELLIEGDSSTDNELFIRWEVFKEVCDIFSEIDKCETISEKDREKKQHKLEWLKKIGRVTPCLVCSIFGYMGQRGRVRFTHAFPPKEDIPIDIITRVAINRYTGAADPGKLFDLEAVPPGVNFFFFIVMENMSNREKEIFEYGIRSLDLNLATLGAHSTVGFGIVEIKKVYALKIDPCVFEIPIENINFVEVQKKGFNLVEKNIDITKYPRFFNLLSLRKDGNLPDEIAKINMEKGDGSEELKVVVEELA